MKVYGTDDRTLLIDRSRDADTHTGDRVAGDAFFLDLRIDSGSHIRKDVHAIIFRSCGDLPFLQNVAFYIEKTTFYRCSSDINTKTILFHLILPPDFFFL